MRVHNHDCAVDRGEPPRRIFRAHGDLFGHDEPIISHCQGRHCVPPIPWQDGCLGRSMELSGCLGHQGSFDGVGNFGRLDAQTFQVLVRKINQFAFRGHVVGSRLCIPDFRLQRIFRAFSCCRVAFSRSKSRIENHSVQGTAKKGDCAVNAPMSGMNSNPLYAALSADIRGFGQWPPQNSQANHGCFGYCSPGVPP